MKTIFDALENESEIIPIEEKPSGKEGFFKAAANAPAPKDDSFFNTIQEYGKSIIKGFAIGVHKFGRMMGPLQEDRDTLEESKQALEEYLPTEDEGFGQKALRRGLEEAPSMMAQPFGNALQTLPRSIAAGFLGEGAKELGAPEWVQTAAELTAYIGPDLTKKLLVSGNNKELIEATRKLGMSDEAITPLLQSEFKQKWLAKVAPKRGATEKALRGTKEALGEAYDTIRKGSKAGVEVSEKVNGHLINDLKAAMAEMPRDVQGKISKDLEDLLANKITPNTLMNFYKDVNAALGGSTKQLTLLKEPIKKAIRSVSPELAKDFEFVNELYGKYSTIAGRLKPNLTSDIISAAEALGITGSVLFGNYPTLIGIIGEKAGKKLSQQMLINPHFQQLSQKMVVAINQNKFGLAKKITEELNKEIAKFSPEASEHLQELTLEDFKRMTNPKKSTEQQEE